MDEIDHRAEWQEPLDLREGGEEATAPAEWEVSPTALAAAMRAAGPPQSAARLAFALGYLRSYTDGDWFRDQGTHANAVLDAARRTFTALDLL